MPPAMPLPGEPLPLDLVNTVWFDGAPHDLFDTPTGARDWLAAHQLPLEGQLEPLREAREAVRAALVQQPHEERLNAILTHGARTVRLRDGEPEWRIVVDAPQWHAAWACVAAYIDLRAQHADRIRGCAGHACQLWFLDSTKNARRRWCSMSLCGNRAKAERYQRRHRV